MKMLVYGKLNKYMNWNKYECVLLLPSIVQSIYYRSSANGGLLQVLNSSGAYTYLFKLLNASTMSWARDMPFPLHGNPIDVLRW